MIHVTMTVKGVKLGKLLRQLKKDAGKLAVERGILSGCYRGLAELQNRSTQPGVPFHTGRYRLGWKAMPIVGGARIYNDAPYSAIIEEGRRPGSKMPPRGVIERWAQLKLGLSASDAKAAAFPIARAIARRGLKGHHILRDAVPKLTQLVEAEVVSEVTKAVIAVGGTP